jgi:glycosyltransferase involved in cell wall biosynthesis
MSPTIPLVSIGIPTYNRESLVARAIASALDQDYPNIEVLVSDNASTDGTAATCDTIAATYANVRVHHQTRNLGPTANFMAVLGMARGKYFMWLGDDDWIDSNYVSQTLQCLLDDPQVTLASGTPVYYAQGERERVGRVFSALSPLRLARILSFYWNVDDNGTFYGLMKRSDLLQTPLPNRMGGDWFFVASFASRGKIGMLGSSAVHRELGGATASYKSIANVLGLSGWHAMFPFVSIAISAFRDIMQHGPAYRPLPGWERLGLGLAAFACILAKAMRIRLQVRLAGIQRRCRRFTLGQRLPRRFR